ncbi:pesticidal protein Cry7Aa [Candidatus Woesearchaeota archaeon]|nr:pesticidal protein Cry7Aa [Candidatus Woesearchaeota archaeon]MBI2661822.1 pesticidal protein Cry7Aa [Candidatus Woesearchaeota archaeon]
MLKVKKEGVVLEKTRLEFENQAVLNPACVQDGYNVHMFYRAVRKGNYSSIGYAKLEGPMKVVERSKKPVLSPEQPYEMHGIEDPRIVCLDGTYYMFYTAYDGKNALAAYAVSKDLKKWEKKGIISPRISYDEAEDIFRRAREKHGGLKDRYFFFESYYKDIVGQDVLLWEKDVFLFPKKINGKYALVHRILPDMHIAYFKRFSELTLPYWKKYLKNLENHILLDARHWFESRNIGGGAPPIETEHGWLLIYHAVEDRNKGKIYRAGAALMDRKNPQKRIGHLDEPLFSPEEKYEMSGDVDNVVFPTGTSIFGDKLYIYYGAADKRIAAVSVSMKALLKELMKPARH